MGEIILCATAAMVGAGFASGREIMRFFSLRIADDRSLEIIPTDEALENPGWVAASYKSTILLTGRQWQAETEELTLTVKKTLPKVKASAAQNKRGVEAFSANTRINYFSSETSKRLNSLR